LTSFFPAKVLLDQVEGSTSLSSLSGRGPQQHTTMVQGERWSGIIPQRAIRRGSFSRVKELITRIEQFVAAYNKIKAHFN
jgi:hypothetical protein